MNTEVTALFGNPKDPSRIEHVGIYRTRREADLIKNTILRDGMMIKYLDKRSPNGPYKDVKMRPNEIIMSQTDHPPTFPNSKAGKYLDLVEAREQRRRR